MAVDHPFDHNPVFTSLQIYNTSYRIATFNVHGVNDVLLKDAVEHIGPDIMFCQEIQSSVRNIQALQDNYDFYYNPGGQEEKHAAFLTKKNKFKAIAKVMDSGILSDYETLRERQYTIVLSNDEGKTLVAISWHGQSGVDDETKGSDFINLMMFAREMREIYSADVIIGGDFNLRVEEADNMKEEFSLGFPDQLIGVRAGKDNIDFFLYTQDMIMDDVGSDDLTNY